MIGAMLVLLHLMLTPATTWAQSPSVLMALGDNIQHLAAQPTLQHRLVRLFDFEERKLGNFEDLPMHWYIMGRSPATSDPTFLRKPLHEALTIKPGYPTFTSAGFDKQVKADGEFSFKLSLNGGNVGAFLEVGTIPAVPGSDYMLTAQVRTTELRHARAYLHVYFLDAQGRPIEGGRVSSAPITSDQQWRDVSVTLPGDHPSAAWIGLEIEVLQPSPRQTDTLSTHEIHYQDIQGEAWFDNIALWQVPRVMVQTQSPYNMLRAPEKPKLRANVQDLTGHALVAELRLRDWRGQVVDRMSQRVGEGAPMNVTWEPRVEHFGWYTAELILIDQVAQDGQGSTVIPLAVAQDVCDFLYLPMERSLLPEEATHFLIDATPGEAADPVTVPKLLELSGLGGAVLSAFAPAMQRSDVQARQAWLDHLLEQMLLAGKQANLSMSPLPEELAAEVDARGQGLLACMANDDVSWHWYMAPIVVNQGPFVYAWQLGDFNLANGYKLPNLGPTLQTIEREFRALSPQPRLMIPWRLEQGRRREVQGDWGFHLLLPANIPTGELPALLQEWREEPSSKMWVQVETTQEPRERWSGAMAQLAIRMLEGWTVNPQAILVRRPWEELTVVHRKRVALQPAIGVMTGLSPRLAGRKLAGELPLGPQVRCLVLDGPGGGALAIWHQEAAGSQIVRLFLGGQPESVDLWGNRTPVPMSGGLHEMVVTGSPQIIEGIDAALALFRTSFRVTPSFLESTQAPRKCVLTLSNPWNRVLTGTVLFTQPTNWRVTPRRLSFTLSPQQTAQFPLEIQLPVSETAGGKLLWARVELTPDQQYVLELSAPMEVGMKGLKFDAVLSLERNPQTGTLDAVVKQTIVNIGEQPVSLYCYATLPGFPRQERLVTQLEPGKPALRRFRFVDAQAMLDQHALRTGVREVGGPAILNKTISGRDAVRSGTP